MSIKKPVPDLLNHADTTALKPSRFSLDAEGVAIGRHWFDKQLAKIPEDFHSLIRTGFEKRCNSGDSAEWMRRKSAKAWLLERVKVLGVYRRGVPHDHYATVAKLMLDVFSLEEVAQWASTKGVNVPRFSAQDTDVHQKNSRAAVAARLCSSAWWEKQLTKRFRRDAEAAQIRAGNVCRGVSPYVSQEAREAFQWRQSQLEAWKKQALLISNEGDEISLDGSLHEHSATFIKFAEFMVRINGMSAIAADEYISDSIIQALPEKLKQGMGGELVDLDRLAVFHADADELEQWVGLGITLTTPSRFHRYKFNERTQRLSLNPHYDSSKTPSSARDWLQETWKLTQTAWKRETDNIRPIEGFGFRMDESHHDGVSHYHYGVWVKAKDVKRALEIFYNKALRGAYADRLKQRQTCKYGEARDASEKGAAKRRLNFKVMTNAKGMVSYMVKYITKGLTGADWEDLKSGVSADESLINLMARKSLWGFRQYSFWNAPSITTWRELRRIAEPMSDELLESARLAAIDGDWKRYVQLNGGVTCQARKRPLRLYKVNKEDATTGEPAVNAYGEYVEQVRGVLLQAKNEFVQTRLKDWYLLNMGSLRELLVKRFLRESGHVRSELPPNFASDIQQVINQAKEQGKVSRLANKANIELFSSRMGGLPPLGLVGLTSHGTIPTERQCKLKHRAVRIA